MRRLLAVLLAAALCLLPGCAEGGQDDLTVLTIATADSGGTMYPVGSAIADVLSSDKVKVNVSSSTGSAMNVQNILDGEADLALVSGDAAYEACRDSEEAEDGLRAVAAVCVSQSNWLAPESGGAVYVHDLAGKRVGAGPQGSSSERTALIALEAAGLSGAGVEIRNCSLGTGGELVLSGDLDAVHGFTGAPINGLSEVADQLPCRILRYTDEELNAILARGEIYVPVLLAAGTYTGQREDVRTFGVKCLLCVSSSMDEDLACELTRQLWEHREELAQAHAAMRAMSEEEFLYEALPVPLHPGAEKFYSGCK